MYFLRKLGSLHVDKSILSLFYKSIVEIILLFNCVVWFGACRKEDFKKMETIVKRASKIIGEGRHLEQECKDKIFQKTKEILANEGHTWYHFYQFIMRSGKRMRSLKCRTKRYLVTYTLKNTLVSVTRKRVHWGQTPFPVNDDREISQTDK